MRKTMLLLAILGLAGSLWAQSPFDGAWKLDLSRIQLSEKPEIWAIENGIFQCPTCEVKSNVKADGTDQSVKGSNSYDTLAVKVVDDKTIEFTNKKDGRVVAAAKHTVMADGNTVTVDATQYPEGGKPPVRYKETYVRIASGPTGSHAFSGSWLLQKVKPQESTSTITLKSSPNGLTFASPVGESFDANFDGKEYPIKDATGYTMSLTKVNDHSINTTIKLDGKVMGVTHMTVSVDGKTLTIESENKQQGTTTTLTATKQ